MLTSILGLHAVVIDSKNDAVLAFGSQGLKYSFRSPSPAMRALVELLGEDRLSAEGLVDEAIRQTGTADERDRLHAFLGKLDAIGLLSRTLVADGEPLVKHVYRVHHPARSTAQPGAGTAYGLSRFCHLHAVQGRLALESPLSQARVELLHPSGAALIERLATCRTVEDLRPGLPPAIGRHLVELLALLLQAGLVGEGPEHAPHAAEDIALQQWEFHDLLFHARSRFGRHDGPIGRTFHFLGRAEPLPAVRTDYPGPFIELCRPDIAALTATDVPFTKVLESRRSIRRFGSTPITLRQLGEFLYRVARVRRILPADGQSLLYDSSDRTYPGGGGCYELEIHLVVDRCADLAPGLYHYDPLEHRLSTYPADPAACEALLRDASRANGSGQRPPVLFVLTARFGRMMWKYQTLAYAAILKDVGVLYQSMYLVATAMGLAPCAIGGGDPEPMRRMTGDPYWVESSVGEFMLGTLPDAEGPA